MKRNLSGINKNNIKNIIRWVNLSSPDEQEKICPISVCKTCKEIFPKLPEAEGGPGFAFVCPCTVYKISYVTKVAKQIIKEWEVENEK